MKRIGNLYPQIIDFSNLYLAAQKAQKGKRFRPNVLEFNYNLEAELITIQKQLVSQSYQPGEYHTFYLRETKIRMISAAPYRDRVVHHALCNIITPIFETGFIDHSYANRIGLGTHKALETFTKFARSSQYILQCDIQKYFPSIDHQILKQIIRSKIKCPDTLWLIDTIIDNSNEQLIVREYFPGDTLLTPIMRRKGLPIGNLTSQFFANVYLNKFDHFVKQELKVKKYLRYVDDFVLCDGDRSFLAQCRQRIENYLAQQLRLKIHPIKSQLFETALGVTFLGFRVLPENRRVKNENLQRGRRRIKKLQRAYNNGNLSLEQVQQSLQSWIAHLNHGDTYRLQQQIFASLPFKK